MANLKPTFNSYDFICREPDFSIDSTLQNQSCMKWPMKFFLLWMANIFDCRRVNKNFLLRLLEGDHGIYRIWIEPED